MNLRKKERRQDILIIIRNDERSHFYFLNDTLIVCVWICVSEYKISERTFFYFENTSSSYKKECFFVVASKVMRY